MGVYSTWESEFGIHHGTLQRCSWALHDNPSAVPRRAAGIELKVTSPEGGVRWLVDENRNKYGYEYDECLEAEWGVYGHRCWEGCAEFFEEFGWELCPEGQGFELGTGMDTEDDGEGEVTLCGGRPPSPVPEEDEEVVSEVDFGMLDRLADIVFGVRELREEEKAAEELVPVEKADEKGEKKVGDKGKEKELPMWMRDPFYVSNESWADMAEEDDEW
jgi:hypothetical protein